MVQEMAMAMTSSKIFSVALSIKVANVPLKNFLLSNSTIGPITPISCAHNKVGKEDVAAH